MFPQSYWGAAHYGQPYWPPIEETGGGGSNDPGKNYHRGLGAVFNQVNSRAIAVKRKLDEERELRDRLQQAVTQAREELGDPAPEIIGQDYSPSEDVILAAEIALEEQGGVEPQDDSFELIRWFETVIHLELMQDEEDILALLLSL